MKLYELIDMLENCYVTIAPENGENIFYCEDTDVSNMQYVTEEEKEFEEKWYADIKEQNVLDFKAYTIRELGSHFLDRAYWITIGEGGQTLTRNRIQSVIEEEIRIGIELAELEQVVSGYDPKESERMSRLAGEEIPDVKPLADIFHRVSVRKFEERPVESFKIKEILRAAMQAPSAGNQQPWEFYIVKNKKMLEALSKTSQYAGCAADAPMAVVVAYRTDVRFPEFAPTDVSAAMENMWLEADALGLGASWLGVSPVKERMEAVENLCKMPENHRAFAIFPVGYPAEMRPQTDRYDSTKIHEI